MNKSQKKVVFSEVRGSYVYLLKPNKDDKYSMCILFEKDTPTCNKAIAAMKEVFIAAFGEKEWSKKGKYNLCMRDGDADAFNGGDAREGDEYRDHYFMNCSNRRKPGLRSPSNEEPTMEELDELCFSGAYFAVSVNFVAYPAKENGKAGVGCYLNGVMLRRAGERLDGASNSASDFEEFAVKPKDDFDDEDL